MYKRSRLDRRDRLLHETLFLRLLEGAGIDRVPRVLAVDADVGCALQTLVPGSPWPADRVAPPAIWEQFSAFLGRLRTAASLPEATAVPLAAEAGMSLQEHLGWVLDRRDRWRVEARAGKLTAEVLRRVEALDADCEAAARATIDHPAFRCVIDRSALMLSPSDFGLHNALVDEEGVVSFVDFEYAGWDDPLKTESDFAHQPRYAAGRPRRLSCFDGLIDRDSPRATALHGLLALKWRYIVLAADCARSAATPSTCKGAQPGTLRLLPRVT
jgi:hypothetical protein